MLFVGCIAELAPTGCRRTHTVARPRSTRDCGTRPPQSATRLPRSDLARAGRCSGASRCSSDRAVTPRRARREPGIGQLTAEVDDRERDLGLWSTVASSVRAVRLRARRRTRRPSALLNDLVVLGGQRCKSQLETRLPGLRTTAARPSPWPRPKTRRSPSRLQPPLVGNFRHRPHLLPGCLRWRSINLANRCSRPYRHGVQAHAPWAGLASGPRPPQPGSPPSRDSPARR